MIKSLTHLWPYIWPSDRVDLKMRVVYSFAILLAAKIITLIVPFTYKWAVDALTGHGSAPVAAAQVSGPIYFEGNKEPEVSPQAKLASPVDYHKMEHKPHYMEGHYYVWQVIWLAAFVLFGLVLFQLMPRFAAEAVAGAERYGASFGLGVLVFFGAPIAALIACVTVVGLFVGISAFFIWYASLYFAQLIVGAMVGQWLMGPTQETWPLIGRMAVGIVIVRLATIVPILGGWIKFGVILWGLGAISLALYNRFQPTLAASTPSGPYMPPPLPPNTTVGGMQPA